MIFKPWIIKELNDREFYRVVTALRGPDNGVLSLRLKRYTTAYLRWLVFSNTQKGMFHLHGGSINDGASLVAPKLVEKVKNAILDARKIVKGDSLNHFLSHSQSAFAALSSHLEYIPKGHKNKVKVLARDDTYGLC